MFDKYRAIRKAKKEAAAKAKATYDHIMALNKAKKTFLSGDDDPNFIAELFRGIEGHQNVKVIYIKKLNGTTITIPLSDDYLKANNVRESDWIDFDSLTDSQGLLEIN